MASRLLKFTIVAKDPGAANVIDQMLAEARRRRGGTA